ncbi:hypothetical protein THAOC_05959 [Thalassiosira oceanica]|uniref:Uncharacterized protein n=1 Tax=Thalassiosira oceanica TaxID=159749 RepID=K0TM92_THAOC|nr:hypothetical protein THAOC_05959 [Thalassiosira oceanica]|eukprot:EJK72507.1 hypothetical protein THAOC_05959 [Thalassiosira oceanica]
MRNRDLSRKQFEPPLKAASKHPSYYAGRQRGRFPYTTRNSPPARPNAPRILNTEMQGIPLKYPRADTTRYPRIPGILQYSLVTLHLLWAPKHFCFEIRPNPALKALLWREIPN